MTWWEAPLRPGEFDVPVMFRVTADDEVTAREKVQRIVYDDQFERHIVPIWVPPLAMPICVFAPAAGAATCEGTTTMGVCDHHATELAGILRDRAAFLEEDHPEHDECWDGCGLEVTHAGACRAKPGGPAICEHLVRCDFCGGEGREVGGGQTCPQCHGSGEMPWEPATATVMSEVE